jgi:hypothetical protein
VDDVLLADRNFWPAATRICSLTKVDAGDQLGGRVFDLDAGVDLDEIKVVVLIDEELAGAGARRSRCRLASGAAAVADLAPDALREVGARRLLDELLVPALSEQSRSPAGGRRCPRGRQQLTSTAWARLLEVFLEVDRGRS